ncbi:MAG: hypothetical protein WCT10_00795 [Patescibacteria group bacterium]|jgi:hypothetical protein
MNELLKKRSFRIGAAAIGGLILLIVIFQAGMAVGFRKARFSYQWGENYHKMFGGPQGGFAGDFRRDFEGRDFMNANGVAGAIIKIDGRTLVIRGVDGAELVVLLADTTVIRAGRETVRAEDLTTEDSVVVIGEPDTAGQIAAKFIRVFPQEPPPGPFFERRLPPR